jgi:bifunctional non-homologous end joining protein LigD
MKLRAGRDAVELSNPDKPLFGAVGRLAPITKRDLAEYYLAVAPAMIPHLRRRPLAVERFPDGVDGDGFMQKSLPPHAPDFVHRIAVGKVGGGELTMIVCDNAATLLYLANQAALTLHPWPSQEKRLDRPDRMIFDLDPGDDDFAVVQSAARELHGVLDEIGLPSYPMISGSRGVHVTVPITPREEYDDVRAFALDVATVLADRRADQLTTAVRKVERKGRLFIDTLRNAYGQHAVAPYSVRPLPGAPVATPLTWEELDERGMKAQRFTNRDIPDRVAAGGDPWRDIGRHARSLGRARKALANLTD